MTEEYEELVRKWRLRIDAAVEADGPLEVTPEEYTELKRMESLRQLALTPEQAQREEADRITGMDQVRRWLGTPVVVVHARRAP